MDVYGDWYKCVQIERIALAQLERFLYGLTSLWRKPSTHTSQLYVTFVASVNTLNGCVFFYIVVLFFSFTHRLSSYYAERPLFALLFFCSIPGYRYTQNKFDPIEWLLSHISYIWCRRIWSLIVSVYSYLSITHRTRQLPHSSLLNCVVYCLRSDGQNSDPLVSMGGYFLYGAYLTARGVIYWKSLSYEKKKKPCNPENQWKKHPTKG